MGAGLSGSPIRRCVLLLVISALTACAVKEVPAPPVAPLPPSPPPPAVIIPHTQYTIQLGAFSRVENAIRLTASLEQQGLNAYYYRDGSGLFKVRFGDFAARKEAFDRAQSLQAEGIIQEYYIVSPDAYRAARARRDEMAALRADIVETAERFIGIPYQWGGMSPDGGFDCSGLVMAVYQLNGYNLPRTSRDQYTVGSPIGKDKLKKGDLVFFSFRRSGAISHVGVYTGDDVFIHAPGRGKTIRKDSLSAPCFASRFAGARTYLK